jgi:uncharacterized protein (TIGR04551 family)
MRLRLEPTINLDEGTSIHVQADVLDNIVLGSTPTDMDLSGIYNAANPPPLGAFGENQDPVTQGINSDRSSIIIKRAWAEMAVPLGILKFGRMPNQWGMGIYYNAGGADPINGTYNYDADYEDSVDRVSFSALIPGTDLRAMVAYDWNLSRLVSNQTSDNKGHVGHPFDLDNADDSTSWVGVISKMDSPQEFRDTVDRGDAAFNWGVWFEYKKQENDDNLTDFTLGGVFDPLTKYVPRDAKFYIPDLWAKFGWGPILLEAELIGQFGSIKHLDDLGFTGEEDVRKFGGSARLTWRGVENKLRLGAEGGFATGDQWDNIPQGNTNIAFQNMLGDPAICNATHKCTLTQFTFDRSYIIDMILWRHLVGAVTNAAYAKPTLSYDLTKSITFNVANITSFALKPVAWPGNETMIGTEFNGELVYTGQRLIASIAYGVLFPLGALNHPANDTTSGGPGFPFGGPTDPLGNNTGSAQTAHEILVRMVLPF